MPTTSRTITKRCQNQGPSSESFDESGESSGRGRGEDDEDGSIAIDENHNPLLHDVVLATLFKYVTGNDMKVSRLVCKKWHHRTLPLVGSRLKVTISSESGKVKDFVELIKSNTLEFPKFETFFLGPFDIKERFFQEFLQLCGQKAKEFILVSEDRSSYHDTIEDISELFRSAPNLISFTTKRMTIPKTDSIIKLFPDSENTRKSKLPFLKTMNLRDDWIRNTMQICPTFYQELFEAADNLSTLIVQNLSHDDSDLGLDILRAVERVGNVSTIRNFKIDRVTPDHMDSLQRMALKPNGLKLKQLDLQLWQGQIDWCELLSYFMDTLVTLRVDSFCCTSSLNSIPCMANLKFLYLHLSGYNHLTCENFQRTFPALESVYLSFNSSKQFEDLMTGDEMNQIMKSTIQCFFPMEIEIVNRIRQLFPNTRIFKCRVDPESGVEVIQNIWTHMTQLEKLTIYGTLPASTNLDSLVTGISTSQIQEIRDRKGFFDSLGKRNIKDRREKILAEINNFDELVSVRNLTNLNSLNLELIIEVERGENQLPKFNFLTDLAAYLAFYPLKNLRHLRLTNCEFSKSCAELLVKDMGLTSWKFQLPKTWNPVIPFNWKESDELNTFPIQL